MNQALTLDRRATPQGPVSATGLSPHFRRDVLWMVVACGVPAAGLLGLGRLTLAANYFWAALALCIAGLLVTGRYQMLLSVVMGALPFINLLRGHGFAFYNMLLVVAVVTVVHYFVRVPQSARQLVRGYRGIIGFGVVVTLYYLVSVAITRDYVRNLRLFELYLGVVCVLLAARSRRVLGTGLLGVIVSSIVIGLGMLPNNATVGRLGMVILENTIVGNPVQLGMALAFGFLLLTVDRSQWLSLPAGRVWKWILLVPAGVLLALTTSRAAWLVACGGMLVTALLGRGQRLRMLLVIALVPVLVVAALKSPFGNAFREGLDRTFGENRSLDSRTSGRTDQWRVAFVATTASWDRMLWGYGPGKGAAVYAQFSERVEGVRYNVGRAVDLHSLFMQAMVEAGLIGLLLLAAALLALGVQTFLWARRTGLLLPSVCWAGYVLSITTIAGTGVVDGMILGMAFLALERKTAAS